MERIALTEASLYQHDTGIVVLGIEVLFWVVSLDEYTVQYSQFVSLLLEIIY